MLLRLYGAITAIIGLIHFVDNLLWLRTVAQPIPTPRVLTWFEMAWGFVSFAVVLRRSGDNRALPLAASYVTYLALAMGLSFWIGTTRGDVTDEMIPTQWKLIAMIVGAWFVVGGVRLARGRAAGTNR
jgi:hypothetical protein